MTQSPHIKLEFTSDPKYLCGVRELVASIADRMGFSDESCGQIKLAVDEALCNVVRHGYDRDVTKPIWLTLTPVADNGTIEGIRIVIEDEAKQIDPDKIKGRDLDEIRPGGLGVHIIREIMDEVVYAKRNPVGMRLTLVKSRNSDAMAPTQ